MYIPDNKGRATELREVPLPIFGVGTKSRFLRFDTQRTINLYQTRDQHGNRQTAYFPTPGRLSKITVPGNSVARPGGALATDQFAYVIYGSTVYQQTTSNTLTTIDNVSTSTGLVGMLYIFNTGVTPNAFCVVIVDGSLGWIYNVSTGNFAQITDPGFPVNANSIASLDNYVLVSQGGTQIIKVSAINNPTSYPGTIAMQTAGETVINMTVLNKRLLVFGKKVTEIFYNAGIATNIFAADYNLKMEYGLAAAASLKTGFGYSFWVGSPANGPIKILMTDGTRPTVISTENLNRILATYRNPSDAVGNLYESNGIVFYEVSFNQDNATWVYCVTSQSWSEKQEVGGVRSAIQTYYYFNLMDFVGLYNSNKICEMSDRYADNDGDPIRRTRISSVFYDEKFYHPINISRVILECLSGEVNNPRLSPLVGNVQKPNNDPNVYFSVSRDGGYTYSNPWKIPIGKVAEYLKLVFADNLGEAVYWVFKIEFDALSIQALFGATGLVCVKPGVQ